MSRASPAPAAAAVELPDHEHLLDDIDNRVIYLAEFKIRELNGRHDEIYSMKMKKCCFSSHWFGFVTHEVGCMDSLTLHGDTFRHLSTRVQPTPETSCRRVSLCPPCLRSEVHMCPACWLHSDLVAIATGRKSYSCLYSDSHLCMVLYETRRV